MAKKSRTGRRGALRSRHPWCERAQLREQFATFFVCDSLALDVRNGCQMLSQLKPIILRAERWSRILSNRSEQSRRGWDTGVVTNPYRSDSRRDATCPEPGFGIGGRGWSRSYRGRSSLNCF